MSNYDPSSAPQSWEAESTRHFYYDGWNVIRETIHSTLPSFQSSTNLYTWGNDLSGTLQGAGGVGGLLAVSCVSSNTSYLLPLTYYPLFDHNGNVERYVTRNGTTVATFQYDAFGNTISETFTQSGIDALTHFRFSTKYWEGENELYYYGYRHYCPWVGRWINRDPIGEHENRGLYCCCNNNPIIRSDFLGLSVQMVPCKCNEKEINMYAYGLTKRAQYLSNQKPLKWYGETYYMEYCGIVCCDQETGVVSVKGPIEGDFRYQGRSDGAFNRDYYMKVPFYYKNGKRVDSVAKTCGDTVAGQLKCEGKISVVRNVHVHPADPNNPAGGTSFSRGDASWQPITVMLVTPVLADSTAIYILFNNQIGWLHVDGTITTTTYQIGQIMPPILK